jgi:hypothetical protein
MTDMGADRDTAVPDIVIAGFPKAGTTALASLLAGHPEIALMEPKEPHRYSWGLEPDLPPANRANGMGATPYAAAIAAARRNGRLVIDASTSYAHPAVAVGTAARLAAADAGLKVILAVRDPVKRLISDWGMRQAEGWAQRRASAEVRRALDALAATLGAAGDGADGAPGDAALVERAAASRAWMGLARDPGAGSHTLLSSGFYDPLIAVYRARFGDALLVVPQEALRSDQDAVLARCFAHLGVAPRVIDAGEAEFNVGDHRVETALSRLLRQSGVAWIARHLLPHALVARARHAVTDAPLPPVNDLAESPEGALARALYARLAADTARRMQTEFGVRWSIGG